MEIRKAIKEDIEEVVSLLKLSLGESLMPKSVEYWTWKHINNPFGKSPVLLAIEDGKIIGVRAFMNWQWKNGEKIYKAIRAVDTATHPEHQGKGIFKKLTLGLLDDCKQQGVDFVFNTPNSKSKPGYLKMGWKEVGKLPVRLGFKRPINIVKNKLFGGAVTDFIPVKDKKFDIAKSIDQYELSVSKSSKGWKSNYSKAYLHWRYVDIPLIKYGGLGSEEALVIFRLKQGGFGIELRICEAFGSSKEVESIIQTIYKNCNFDYISIDAFSSYKLPSLINKVLGNGPDVTVRPLNGEVTDFEQYKLWSPVLGDLEVF
ncbi:GNAT family N-acetyltransferase [Fulvivirga maritima]|uniref:GNAT family N-acetyltransferase n=1 Tax=Fulvivirga maritima TaxID=2904247 RepID=UPI001F1F0BA2|nr:GNAT family N-acetyltransferase [Fulvivirga maritima]UII24846.1 GNAT family N-acetyltransferase [Fulvivirga maritima]